MKGQCAWVLAADPPAVCGKPTGWVMRWDGDEEGSTKVRRYNVFCRKHRDQLAHLDEEAAEDPYGPAETERVLRDVNQALDTDIETRGRVDADHPLGEMPALEAVIVDDPFVLRAIAATIKAAADNHLHVRFATNDGEGLKIKAGNGTWSQGFGVNE